MPSSAQPGSEPSAVARPSADVDRWDRFLAGRPEATLYQTLRWARFVERVFGHRFHPVVCEREGELAGVLPLFEVGLPVLGRKLISIPFDAYSGGPIAVDGEAEAFLVARAAEEARQCRARYVELRCARPSLAAVEQGFQHGEPVLVTRLELAEDEEATLAAAHKHHRRSLRQFQKSGIAVAPARDLQELRAFYSVYLELFRSVGTPPYGWRYYRTLWEEVRPQGGVEILLAKDGAEVVGGMLLFGFGESLVMKFVCVLPDAVKRRASAGLYWGAIRLALAEGRRWISWGTSTRAQEGLLEYKERWGGTSAPVHFHSLPLRGSVPDIEGYYDSEGLSRRAWKRLPLAVTALLGPHLNRWFC